MESLYRKLPTCGVRGSQMLNYRFYYRRNLPHYQPEHTTLFVTCRLAGSIPVRVVRQLTQAHEETLEELRKLPESCERSLKLSEAQRRAFGKWDAALHESSCGPRWLEDARIARLIGESLRYRHERVYCLHAYSIMPNHLHIVFSPLPRDDGSFHSLASIMHSLKRHTATEANRLLGLQGDFWQHENYDHSVRGEAEYRRILEYVLNNPVKAGLAREWQDWPWNYVAPDVLPAG